MSGLFLSLGLQAVALAAGLFAFGYLLADAIAGHRDLDGLTRWALAVPALVTYALVLMLAHLVTGGRVFSHPLLVRALTVLIAAGLLIRRRRPARSVPRADRTEWIAAAATVLAGLAVWSIPVFRLVPLGVPGSDTGWHMGWASQLLAGHTTPSAAISGGVPNYYPWLFHAVVALLATFTPGGNPYRTLGPLQLLQVAGVMIALFVLGRTLWSARSDAGRLGWVAGTATAVFGGLAAGVGVVLVRGAGQIVGTGGSRATYNVVYNNVAPPLPRDLGYVLFVAFLVPLMLGLRREDGWLLAIAGTILGLAGITSSEFFFVGLAVAGISVAIAVPHRRLRAAIALFVPALVLFGLWLVPLFLSYIRLGGFVNTSATAPVIIGPAAILTSWGLVTPFGAFGLARAAPALQRRPEVRVALATVAASALLLLACSVASRSLGPGFTVIGRASRYWPILYLSAALLAGFGAADAVRWMLDHALNRWAGIAVTAAAATILTAMMVARPVASSATPRRPNPSTPALAAAILGDPDTVFGAVARAGEDCVVAAPVGLAFDLFTFTGDTMVALAAQGAHPGNAARIRWRDIYATIPSDTMRRTDAKALLGPSTDQATWEELAARYDVDLVVVPGAAAGSSFHGHPRIEAGRSGSFAVFRVAPCGR